MKTKVPAASACLAQVSPQPVELRSRDAPLAGQNSSVFRPRRWEPRRRRSRACRAPTSASRGIAAAIGCTSWFLGAFRAGTRRRGERAETAGSRWATSLARLRGAEDQIAGVQHERRHQQRGLANDGSRAPRANGSSATAGRLRPRKGDSRLHGARGGHWPVPRRALGHHTSTNSRSTQTHRQRDIINHESGPVTGTQHGAELCGVPPSGGPVTIQRAG